MFLGSLPYKSKKDVSVKELFSARISIGYIVGMAAGLKIYVFINSNILMQIQNSAIDFSKSGWEIFNHILILIGVISGLVYFSSLFIKKYCLTEEESIVMLLTKNFKI